MRTLLIPLLLLGLGACKSVHRSSQSDSETSSLFERDGKPSNAFEWSSWFRRNYPQWHWASSPLERDAKPWPGKYSPEKNPVYAYNDLFYPGFTPQQVLAVMVKSEDWTKFYPNSSQPIKNGAGRPIERLKLGDQYAWTTMATPQKMSIVELVDNPKESAIAWEGGSLGTHVYHRWIMRAVEGGTLVITEECEYGALATLDQSLMNPGLHAAHQLWLESMLRYMRREKLGDLYADTEADKDVEWSEKLSWMDTEYTKVTEAQLAPGIFVSYNAGGNSILVSDKAGSLLIDSKFDDTLHVSNGASKLSSWVSRQAAGPVRYLVNTHYHYDHTFGNHLYEGAEIVAHEISRDLMMKDDPKFWQGHEQGLPSVFVSKEGRSLKVGAYDLKIYQVGRAHTASDLWVRIEQADVVVLGDMMFHTYYPFFDESKGGSSLKGIVLKLRELAAKYPKAIFVPGHGPAVHAAEVLAYADYIASLDEAVNKVVRSGLTAENAWDSFDRKRWRRRVLPSMHGASLKWATAKTSFLSAYRIAQGVQGD